MDEIEAKAAQREDLRRSRGASRTLLLFNVLVLACQGSADSSTTAQTSTATLPASTTTTAIPEPSFPAPFTGQGGEVWVVVLAGSEDPADPLLAEATAVAAEAGYSTGPTDCDVGAASALGFPDGTYVLTVSVYLGSEADARQAQAAFAARGVEGTAALVQTFCLD